MNVKRCPECKQIVHAEARIRQCGKCGRYIERHDKWHFVPHGKSIRMEHRHCNNPDSYLAVTR